MIDTSFSIGIEEEYFLVDSATRAVATTTPDALFDTADAVTRGRAKREFLQAQIEVCTRPNTSMDAAQRELRFLRREAAAAAAPYGLTIIAAATHPTARWAEIRKSEKGRYDDVISSLQMIGRRNMLCGTHVHVELPDPSRRVEVMSRMLPYLPLLLALSTSSPFWQGQCTGLKGYRLAAYDELPRTGIPECFRGAGDYETYVAALVRSGAIPDASHIWWAIRPSVAYPTLELRAMDCCTRLADTIAIAALYRSLVRHLYFDRSDCSGTEPVARALAVENFWRAKRYGIEAEFASAAGAIPLATVLDETIERVRPDAEALGCLDHVQRCRSILASGTSADVQLDLYLEHLDRDGPAAAFDRVTKWLVETTALTALPRQATEFDAPVAAE